jgi:hypothetical protein
MFRRTPAAAMLVKSAEPPELMNGRGMPVIGKDPVTTPMLTQPEGR